MFEYWLVPVWNQHLSDMNYFYVVYFGRVTRERLDDLVNQHFQVEMLARFEILFGYPAFSLFWGRDGPSVSLLS